MTRKNREARLGSPAKLQVVDLVRAFSILSVLAYHLYGMPPASPRFQWFWKPFASNGVYGVFIFFVVSGFLITRLIDQGKNKLLTPRLKEFYVRRAARLLPLLALHISIGAYIVHNITRFGAGFWASILTFSFNWFQAFHPDQIPGLYWGLLWSLSVEEQFYLIYPLALRWLKNQKQLVFVLVGIVILGLVWRSGSFFFPSVGTIFFYKTSFGAFDQIAVGILLYLTTQKYEPFLSTHRGLSSAFVLFGVFLISGTYFWTNSNKQLDIIYSPLLVALGAFLTLLGGLHLPFLESEFWMPLAWPGKFSYGIYLFHGLIYYLIFYSFLQKQDTLTAFLFFAVISTGIMAISYHFFEMPVNRWVRRAFGVKT